MSYSNTSSLLLHIFIVIIMCLHYPKLTHCLSKAKPTLADLYQITISHHTSTTPTPTFLSSQRNPSRSFHPRPRLPQPHPQPTFSTLTTLPAPSTSETNLSSARHPYVIRINPTHPPHSWEHDCEAAEELYMIGVVDEKRGDELVWCGALRRMQ